jgi:hypothetical protein
MPVHVSGLTSGVRAIVAGEGNQHTCALVDGGVQCWGDNDHATARSDLRPAPNGDEPAILAGGRLCASPVARCGACDEPPHLARVALGVSRILLGPHSA